MVRRLHTHALVNCVPHRLSRGVHVTVGKRPSFVSSLMYSVVTTLTFSGLAAAAPAPSSSSNTPTPMSFDLPAAASSSAMHATLDLERRSLSVSACAASPCATSERTLEVPLPWSGVRDGTAMQPVAVSTQGQRQVAARRVLHVRVSFAAGSQRAWEALVVAPAEANAKPKLVWSGETGPSSEGEGERLLLEDGDIYFGHIDRARTVCGQAETLLLPKRLDAATWTFRPVAKHRIPKAVRDGARTLDAVPSGVEPLGSVLGLRGASINDGASPALLDDDPGTAWFETRRGDGKGEFVVFSTPTAVPVSSLSLILVPTKAPPDFAAPTALFLSLDSATYRIALPAGAAAGARFDVTLPSPMTTSCLAVSLDDSDAEGDVSVGLADVSAVPVLPASLRKAADLVTLLDQTPTEADLAARMLANAGARGAQVVLERFASLGDQGKLRAVTVLEAAPCKVASEGLVRLSWDAPRLVMQQARQALASCGKDALGAIAHAFEHGPEAARQALAERYVHLDPPGALAAIVKLVPTAKAYQRRNFRAALGHLGRLPAGRTALEDWLDSVAAPVSVSTAEATAATTASRSPRAIPVIEIGRALSEAGLAPELAPSLTLALAPYVRQGTFEQRWLTAQPIAAAARTGHAYARSLLTVLLRDDDRYLRVRAAEVAAGVPAMAGELGRALADVDARVRRQALISLAQDAASAAPFASQARYLLATDGWTMVRASAAELLRAAPASDETDQALGRAVIDDAPPVRIAAIRAIASRSARSQLRTVRRRAFTAEEFSDVRGEAIEALGRLCDHESVDDLMNIVRSGTSGDGGSNLGLTAILALGRIHPTDLEKRFAGIDRRSVVVREAVRQALATKGVCGSRP